MPGHIETFTTCAGPGAAKPHTKMGGLAGFIISSWYYSGALTIIGGLAFLVGLVWAAGPLGWSAAAVLIIIALVEIKQWYYNERLLCIRDNECAIGTVISAPTAAFDGDRKLNLMPAPFTQLEIEMALLDHLDRNRGMLTDNANFSAPFHPSGAPFMPTKNQMLSNRDIFKDYMQKLKGSDPDDEDAASNMYNQITIGLVDTMMQDNSKNFFNRFYRKDSNEITDPATWNAIPTDYEAINWQANNAKSDTEYYNPATEQDEKLNPMFRFEDNPMVPYLHCEVEGNYVQILLDDFITALTAFAIVTTFLGPVAGAIAAFFAWLIKKIIDWLSGNDGDATEPDIDWDDPDFTGYPGAVETTGDVVAVYGHWIMDTEHHQYFEIHPVRAYYIIARNALGGDQPVMVSGNEEQVIVGDNFDPSKVTDKDALRICQMINMAERQDASSSIPVSGAAALSHGKF